MTRLLKLVGLASVYLMAQPCTFQRHGFNLGLENFNPFGGLSAMLANLTGGLLT